MRYLILTFLLFSVLHIRSQEPACKQFTIKDGLPGSVVYHALQDKNGYIWFATSQGVSCFDGRTFRNFTKEDGLPDNEIIKLYLDKHNNVWFISFMGVPAVYHNGGIQRFDDCKGVFLITEDLRTDSIKLIAETYDSQGPLAGQYVSPDISGKWKFTRDFKDAQERVLTEWPVLRNSSPEKINFYFTFKDDNFLLCVKTDTAVKFFPVRRSVSGNSGPMARSSYSCLTSDKKGIVFILGDTIFYANAYRMDPVISLKQLKMGLPSDISSFFCDDDSSLWINTRSRGLLCIQHFLSRQRQVQAYFDERFCTSIFKDQENGYWITTHGEGVYYLPNLSFYTFSPLPDISNTNALCINATRDNKIVAGFANGDLLEINTGDFTTTRFTRWYNQNKNNRILQVLPLPQAHTYLLVCDKGLYRMRTQHIRNIFSGAVKGIYLSSDTNMFVATNTGMLSFTTAGKEMSRVFFERATCITGSNKRIYWGSLHGLYSLTQGVVTPIATQCPELTGIIHHIDVAPDSSLWVSTQQGIAIIKGATVTCIKERNGLLSNMCKHVSFDKNIAWVSTDKGISRINYQWPATGFQYAISNITEEDGLAANEVNQTVAAGNYIWAATAKGITYFSKSYISRSPMPPLINIHRIMAGKEVLPVTDSIRINQSTGKLVIELSGISYGSGKKMQYEYRLTGLDSGWNNTENNIIEYPALPYGQFIFEARAIDRWGIPSDPALHIVVLHQPPFTKTTWFLVLTYLILAVLLSAGFFLYNRRRQQKRELEYRLKRKVHDLELMALRAQMNPHFIFNCLTSIQYHILRADMRNANTYLHKFSTLIRQTLQHSTESSITLREEIKTLSLYLELEKLRLGERMDYRISVADELNQEEISIPAMIVQPFIENAIIHGVTPLQDRKGAVLVDVKRSGNCIEFIIEDNGPGIYSDRPNSHAVKDHTSMGTGITSRRINAINEMHKNKIIWQVIDKQRSGPATSGTIIHLSFPLIP